jgi:hypothetical protein
VLCRAEGFRREPDGENEGEEGTELLHAVEG